MHWALFWVFGLHQCTKATNISVLMEFQFSWRKKTKDNKQQKKIYQKVPRSKKTIQSRVMES